MTQFQHNGPAPGRVETENRSTTEELERSARELGSETREHVSELKQEGKQRARTLFDDQKESAASHVEGVAEALRSSARELDEQGQQGSATQLSRAADQMKRFGRSLRERDLDGLIEDSEAFARRAPVAFFGAALSSGFLLSRFLKASSDNRHSHDDEQASSPSAQGHEELIPRPATGSAYRASQPVNRSATNEPRTGFTP